MTDLVIFSNALEKTIADLDRQEEERRHENTDATNVMNWIAGVRKRARRLPQNNAQNIETVQISARC
jgi:hypothetical protein